jgi:hypothetical protein
MGVPSVNARSHDILSVNARRIVQNPINIVLSAESKHMTLPGKNLGVLDGLAKWQIILFLQDEDDNVVSMMWMMIT